MMCRLVLIIRTVEKIRGSWVGVRAVRISDWLVILVTTSSYARDKERLDRYSEKVRCIS